MLSKSRFLAGLQCEKRLYWEANDRAAASEGAGEAEPLAFMYGAQVLDAAAERYPGATRIPMDGITQDDAEALTRRAMADPEVPAIVSGAFAHGGIRVRVDLLVREPRGRWSIEEVKATTSLKDEHLDDVAVQLFVLERAGLRIRRAVLLHLDRDYVRRTRQLRHDRLFVLEDLTREARARQKDVHRLTRRFLRVVAAPAAPDVEPGDQCATPRTCPFFDRCNRPPGRYSVLRLPRGSTLARRLEELGAPLDMRRLPEEIVLSDGQARARDAVLRGREHVAAELFELLGGHSSERGYPMHFMDFETFAPPIPRYLRTRVYQALPFQWSVHRLERGGAVTHAEFLHGDEDGCDDDPREPFVESLLRALGTKGTIWVYSSFEESRLKELAEALPRFRTSLDAVLGRLRDLLPILREHYYHPDLEGSFSIKAVLPVVVPSLSYESLPVGDGAAASAAYERMLRPDCNAATRRLMRGALLAYCKQDTLAMVEIRRALLVRAGRNRDCSVGLAES